MTRRIAAVLFGALLVGLGGFALFHTLRDETPTRWHTFLRLNDSRLLFAWLAAMPMLGGALCVRTHWRRGAALLGLGAALQATVAVLMPAEAEKLFSAFMNPGVGLLIGYGAAAWFIVQSFPRFARSQTAVFALPACFALTFAAATGWEGWMTLELPPDFHDEYAYLFQSWTYLDGRFGYPTDRLSPAFEQVHVLNDEVFASRYFPGTAVFLAPFVAAGRPIVAMWFAHALTSGFFALSASRIDRRAGHVAGLLIAAAPGMIAFSNALLSTGPTMAALGAFVWAWFRAHERRSPGFASAAGIAVGFAFLTRPLTAASFGFPFAAYSLLRWWKPRFVGERKNVAVMTAVFAACAALLPVWSFATIGTFRESPYDRYTRVRTPSHVYGFYNAERGRATWTDAVFRPYDEWAINLTPDLALQTLGTRILSLFREGMGGFLFGTFFLLVGAWSLPGRDDRVLVLGLAVAGLALAYTPYWFEGVYGFGYLAEALPILLLVVALTAVRSARNPTAPPWAFRTTALAAFLVLRVLSNVGDLLPRMFEPNASGQFARREKRQIVDREVAALQAENRKILVLIDADPKTAVHSTLVNNHPRLDAPVVRAWAKPELMAALLARYPDRAVYVLEYKGFAQPFEWRRHRGPISANRAE